MGVCGRVGHGRGPGTCMWFSIINTSYVHHLYTICIRVAYKTDQQRSHFPLFGFSSLHPVLPSPGRQYTGEKRERTTGTAWLQQNSDRYIQAEQWSGRNFFFFFLRSSQQHHAHTYIFFWGRDNSPKTLRPQPMTRACGITGCGRKAKGCAQAWLQ